MKKGMACRCALVLAVVASFATLVCATSLEVTSVRVYGNQIKITLHNPTSVEETAGVQVTVLEAGGAETLQSGFVTFAPGSSHTFTLTAINPIVEIGDDPDPIMP